jgi:predicted nucleic acid-binding Zn finger protein
MERCSGHTVKVFGQRGRQFIVSIKDGLPTCTCPAFLISKVQPDGVAWCNHIEAQVTLLCGWRGVSVVVPGKCPKCSKDTEPI